MLLLIGLVLFVAGCIIDAVVDGLSSAAARITHEETHALTYDRREQDAIDRPLKRRQTRRFIHDKEGNTAGEEIIEEY